MARRAARADLLALVALVALDLAAYGALLRPGWMLADYDAFVYFYPLRAYAAAAVQEGRLPLWNPSTFLGVPFIANPQTAVFYPLTALFYWLPVPQAYGISLALHVLLAGLAFYAFGRLSLAIGPPGALVGAAAFMLSGVLSGQYGHLNQISAVAWLPLVCVFAERAVALRSVGLAAAAGAVVGLQLLAGHPQQSYMTLVVTGLVCLWRGWSGGRRGFVRAGATSALVASLGVGLAAIQLAPTAELVGESIRRGGLSYEDAIADSLPPWLLGRALLPGYVHDLGSTELLGWVGVVPLLLAGVAVGAADVRRVALGVGLAVVGLGLALGEANPLYPWLHGVVPGLASFRVPARWLLLYTLGAASLAALGADWLLARGAARRLGRAAAARLLGSLAVLVGGIVLLLVAGEPGTPAVRRIWLGLLIAGALLAFGCAVPRTRRAALPLLLGVVGVELWAAGGDLAPRTPIPLEAYAQARDSTLFVQSRLGGDRFLSIAADEYELKETPDYRERYSGLPERALVGFLVAAKRNEVLTPNVNLLYRIDSVDGYDGGLLPLRRFPGFGGLLTAPEPARPDGVLISRLESLPERRLMGLLNVRVVLAGRIKDHESDGVLYDRSVLVSLRPGERLRLERVPRRGYTSLGLISALGERVADGTPVGRLEVTFTRGATVSVPIVAGRETAAAQPGPGAAPPAGLEVVHPWRWTTAGDPVEYLGRVQLPAGELASIALVNVSPASEINLRALSLIDERDGAFTSLVLDDRLQRTMFFDMKVYEYPGVLPRAYLVHRAIEADDNAGLALLGDPDFAPRSAAVVEPGSGLSIPPSDGTGDAVQVVEVRGELVRLRTSSLTDSLLVLSEAHYPGWQVRVDGRPGRLIRANVLFRGVGLPAGEHEVVFSYDPLSFRLGEALSLLSALALIGLLVLPGLARRRGSSPALTRARTRSGTESARARGAGIGA